MAAKKKTEEEALVKTKVNMVKAQTIESVELIGSANELVGEHHVFHGHSIVTFVNGKANVMSDTAAYLRKQGWVK